jgi:hypothetical protein
LTYSVTASGTNTASKTLSRPIAGPLIVVAVRYFALRDSFSAGEGNAPYRPDSDNPATFDSCHRSEKSDGRLLHQDPQLNATLGDIRFRACSGAVTEDIFSQNHNNPYGEPLRIRYVSGHARKSFWLWGQSQIVQQR